MGVEFSRETQQHQQETQRQLWIHMNTFPLWRKCCPSRLVLINCGFLKAYGKSVLRQPSCNKLPLSKTVGHLGLLDRLNMASRAPCVHCSVERMRVQCCARRPQSARMALRSHKPRHEQNQVIHLLLEGSGHEIAKPLSTAHMFPWGGDKTGIPRANLAGDRGSWVQAKQEGTGTDERERERVRPRRVWLGLGLRK